MPGKFWITCSPDFGRDFCDAVGDGEVGGEAAGVEAEICGQAVAHGTCTLAASLRQTRSNPKLYTPPALRRFGGHRGGGAPFRVTATR